jgi:hypothetical protein
MVAIVKSGQGVVRGQHWQAKKLADHVMTRESPHRPSMLAANAPEIVDPPGRRFVKS